ncbi:low temperature requirement protein A [Luteimicrobium sp. DT211]|uniref:low temperature requirement protein A n=1 Tax=Luteimicrobium sp. DT211 TaxID=3393412 RepID=UPI003CFB9F50
MDTTTTRPQARGALGVVPVRSSHRVTMFEIFFDLVFVFAITRVVAYLEQDHGPTAPVQGLVLLLLLWWAWSAFTWLGNRVRADRGFVKLGMVAAMAGLFLAGVVAPGAWQPDGGPIDAPLVLALAFAAVRVTYVLLFRAAAQNDPRLRTQITLDLVPQGISSVLLVVGAVLGGTTQTVLWSCALLVDFAGGRITSGYRGWRIVSPGHFVERHGLVVIIAFGETLVAAGTGAGDRVMRWPVVAAASLGFLLAATLWSAYAARLAGAAGGVLAAASARRRAELARDGYALGHAPVVVGIVALALGLRLLLADADDGAPAGWTATAALTGGVALYLLALELVRWVMLRELHAAPMLGVLALVDVAVGTHTGPALLVLGLTTAVVVTVVAVEQVGTRQTRSRRRSDRATPPSSRHNRDGHQIGAPMS